MQLTTRGRHLRGFLVAVAVGGLLAFSVLAVDHAGTQRFCHDQIPGTFAHQINNCD